MDIPSQPQANVAGRLRERLQADLAAGRTVVLSPAELASPDVRAALPTLLETLSRTRTGPLAPLQVKGYEILGEIGHGGMSTVYLARHLLLDRYVALKVAPKWLGDGARAVARMAQEARAMARLSHPNIVAIHDVVDAGESIAIAMEWIDGLTLAGLLNALPPHHDERDMAHIDEALGRPKAAAEARGGSALRFFVHLMHDVCRAAHAVHEAGLLHLDIKPSNVLVRRDGAALLADFGVVRELHHVADHTRTFAGTPVYAAPEQMCRRDREIGAATDVYGLGMTLYEALARHQPLLGLDPATLLQTVEGGHLPPLSQFGPIAPDLETVVHKAISPVPAHRYPTAAALADDLQAFLEHRPVMARRLTRRQRLGRWIRNEPWKATLAVALLLTLPAIATLAVILLMQLPRIERTHREERLARANHIKQRTLQEWLVHEGSPEPMLAQLERAMELDPSDGSLVTLVAVATDAGWAKVIAVLERHAAAARRVPSLRLAANRAAERRSFFDDSEAAQLAASPSAIDRYLLALDRFALYGDRRSESRMREAQRRLEEASAFLPRDPLLYGLQAWVATDLEDWDRFEVLLAAGRLHWPDDVVIQAWFAYSAEPKAKARSEEIARQLIAIDRTHPVAWDAWIGAYVRRGEHEAAEQLCRQALAEGVPAAALSIVARQQLIRTIESTSVDGSDGNSAQLPLGARLRMANRRGQEALRSLCNEVLAEPCTPPRHLFTCYKEAMKAKDYELANQVWLRHQELYPDQKLLRVDRLCDEYALKNMRLAVALAPGTEMPAPSIRTLAPVLARLLMATLGWEEVEKAAVEWHGKATSTERQEAASYAGIAAARRGDPAAAARWLAAALCIEVKGKAWYAHALLEDAFLRAGVDQPPEFRDLRLAAARLAQLDDCSQTLKKALDGPWSSVMRADVLRALGDLDGARQAIERARPRRDREPQAPADWRAHFERIDQLLR